MVLLDSDRFLSELNKMFERNKASGTVYLTIKKTNMKPKNSTKEPKSTDYKCLLRATDNKKRISTAIAATQLPKFQSSYNTLLKAHMDSLKRKEKNKAKKEGAKAVQLKKETVGPPSKKT